MRFATLVLFLLFFSLFTADSYAVNIDEYYENTLESNGVKELSEYLTEDARDYLEKLGLENPDPETMLSASPKAVFLLLCEMLRNGFDEPLKALLKAVGTVLLVSVCMGFFPDDEKSKAVLNLICGCVIVLSVFVPAVSSVNAAFSAVKSCAVFEKALIPVLAGVVTASGNPTLAISFKGLAFAAAEAVESVASRFALPLTWVSGALGIIGAMLPTLRLSAVSEVIRKTMTTVLACTAGLFTGFLSLRSVLAFSADGLVIKGVKMASSFVPVVGGALGEAYNSVFASIALLKNTVGIYAIVALGVMTIPIALNLALWILSMRVACCISELLDCRVCTEVLRSIAFIFSLTNAVLLLCTAVFVISTGLIISIKSGG